MKKIKYYVCNQCQGQTLFVEKCVWCGSKDFTEKEREVEEVEEVNEEYKQRCKRKGFGGRHFGKDYDGFCLEL
jgi:hypothetical protein